MFQVFAMAIKTSFLTVVSIKADFAAIIVRKLSEIFRNFPNFSEFFSFFRATK